MHLPMPIPVLRTACAQRGDALPQMDRVAVDVTGSPVYVAPVPAEDVVSLWSSLRALHESSGWWPVLAGDPGRPLVPWEMLDGGLDPSALSLGTKHNPVSLLQDCYVRTFPESGTRHASDPCPDPRAARPADSGPTGLDLVAGPTDVPAPSLVHDAADLAQYIGASPAWAGVGAETEAEREPLFEPDRFTPWAVATPTTLLMLVRASAGHEVPALLNWSGACNHGLEGHHHMSVLRHFREEYGAELVGMTGDVIELLAERAPTTPGAAALAAMEMYAYCPDIVLQGIGSVEELAESCVPSSDWFLWWD